MKKVCFAASSGGHLEEILNLRGVEDRWEVVLLTESTECKTNSWVSKTYYVPQVNRREFSCLLKLVGNAVLSLRLLLKEKPEAVVSTGALATIPVCLLGKLLKKRVVYIESFARVDHPSMTGKLLYKVADTTIVQWPDLLKFYPKAIYGGAIY